MAAAAGILTKEPKMRRGRRAGRRACSLAALTASAAAGEYLAGNVFALHPGVSAPPRATLRSQALQGASEQVASTLRAARQPNQRASARQTRVAREAGPVLKAAIALPNALMMIAGIVIWRGGKQQVGDGDEMQERWASFAERPMARMMALTAGAVRVGAIALRAKLARDSAKKSALHTRAGKRAVTELVRLGPTYVKLGQILSCREDLVPKEYIKELKKLQDEVPAFSGARAKKIIEQELGKPVSELFTEFDEKPMAAASLGQVHRAKTPEGKELAIKVQRDKLKEMYDLDLAQFDKIAVMLDKYKIGIEGASKVWVDMFEDAKVILYREIDYLAEAENTQRFAKNFAEVKWAKCPAVVEQFTTKKVLAMEYVPGVKISDLAALEKNGFEKAKLSRNLAQAYLLQFCKYGFFNTDPHPGNLAVDAEYPGGRIIFYDFGQACELSDTQADGILQVIQSIVDFDAPACVQAMDKLGCMKEGADFKAIEGVIQNNFKTGKVKSKRSKRKKELTEEEMNATAPKQSETMKYFQLPPALAFVARAITQLEGVGVMLDEDYEFIDFVAEKVPELQVERGAGLSYIAGQIFKNLLRQT